MAIRICVGNFACGFALAAIFAGSPLAALARSTPAELPEIAVAELPREGREILHRIHTNGSFRYERDGAVFGNRERILPARPRGYYREYTVRTPGAGNRGARRIVCGGAGGIEDGVRATRRDVRAAPDGMRTTPEACFYSDDHYRSFSRIRE